MIKKRIDFYKIEYRFLPIVAFDKSEDTLRQKFVDTVIESIDLDKQPTTLETDPSIIIEMLQSGNDFLFGIIGKLEDLEGGILRRLRDKKDKTVVSIESENIKYYVENYTYFYIRLKDSMCAVLSNSSAPRFRMHFCNYLSSITNTLPLESLNVNEVIDDKIDYKLNQVKSISEVDMIFRGSSSMGNDLVDLSDTFHMSQSSLVRANMSLNLKAETIGEKTRDILKNSDLLQSDFEKLKIAGAGSEEKEIEMELIKRILTKKVSIDIDEKYLRSTNDLGKIKEALFDALPAI